MGKEEIYWFFDTNRVEIKIIDLSIFLYHWDRKRLFMFIVVAVLWTHFRSLDSFRNIGGSNVGFFSRIRVCDFQEHFLKSCDRYAVGCDTKRFLLCIHLSEEAFEFTHRANGELECDFLGNI